MTLRGAGIIRGVIGCLVLLQINAQYNGYNSYYDQEAYYKQYPQYTPSQANAYHGYTTAQTVKPNANNVHVIEISIPDNVAVNAAGLISQLLSDSGATNPNAFSVYAYPDMSSQARPSSQKQNNQQTNYYYQQQQYQSDQYAYQQTLKQQQYQKELQQYEQKLREYYAQYPSAAPQQVTTVRPLPPKVNVAPVTPVQPPVQPVQPPIKPVQPVPITPNLVNPMPNDGKSLADLLLANQGIVNEPTTEQSETGGKSLADLIAALPPVPSEKENVVPFSPPTETPKKSLDDLIGNVFTEKPSKPSTETPNAGGKSLAELLAELPPEPETKTHESDVAGGDYGLDVRADESKPKRVKRHIIRETIRKMSDRISGFVSERFNLGKKDDDCNHHEGRDYHSSQHHHGHGHGHEHEHHRGHEDDREHHRGFEQEREHQHGHEYEQEHNRPHHSGHRNNGGADFDQSDHSKKHEPEHHHQHNNHHSHNHHTNVNVLEDNDQKPSSSDRDDKPVIPREDTLKPNRRPQSVDVGTQTDVNVAKQPDQQPRSATTPEPIFDFDIRGGFESRRRKRHNLRRSRRSPDGDDIVFAEEEEKEKEPEKEKETSSEAPTKDANEDTAENVTLSSQPANCTEGTEECGELDSRFGFFGGGGGFRQRPIGSLIGGVVSGVLGGVVGGLNGLNQGYDPYRQANPAYPQYYQNGQPPPYYGNNYPPPQQPPVHIHINNVANAQSQASNTGGVPGFGSNQNAAANAQSQNYQNEFGSFQNTGASGQASNLNADGSGGQLSAANAMNQNYQNELGFGSKNTAQSQSANFDPHGNLALTSSNSGTNHFAGPDGVRDETNSAAQSSLQGQFGTQNSGAQSNTFQGPHGSGSSASSQASSVNNVGGHGFQNSGSNAAANSGNFGGNSFGNAQSGTYTNDQWGW